MYGGFQARAQRLPGSPGQIYYSATLTNEGTTPLPCQVTNTLLMSLSPSAQPGDLRVAVARFRVPTNAIPLRTTVQPLFRDTMLIAYANASTGVINNVSTQSVFPPSSAGGAIRLNTMQELISYLNICIANVHTAAGLAGILGTPSFVWNAATHLLELWLTIDWTTGPQPPIIVFTKTLNDVLVFPHYQLFGPAYDYPFPPGTITDVNWVALRRPVASSTQPYQVNSAYIVLPQMMNRQSAICDLARILLLSTGVGVSGNQQGANSSTPCLTDFVPDTSSIVLGDPLIYTPAFYRWYTVDTPPAQLDRINLRVQYETTFGETHDIIVNPGDHFSILLVFEETV